MAVEETLPLFPLQSWVYAPRFQVKQTLPVLIKCWPGEEPNIERSSLVRQNLVSKAKRGEVSRIRGAWESHTNTSSRDTEGGGWVWEGVRSHVLPVKTGKPSGTPRSLNDATPSGLEYVLAPWKPRARLAKARKHVSLQRTSRAVLAARSAFTRAILALC
jgi:hypothetical protein